MTNTINISAKIEAEIAELTPEEAKKYLQELGLKQSGLDQLITSSYKLLNLITFFTSGPKETRAWTVPAGAKAPQAAGKIHTDFEKGFIRAEVINWQDFVHSGGEVKAKEKGLMHLEGKEYVVQDGDTIYFRFAT
jgi:ribosome-binding ATPase YchF (GTP1/OBG family)